jgi:hypothetical protein
VINPAGDLFGTFYWVEFAAFEALEGVSDYLPCGRIAWCPKFVE